MNEHILARIADLERERDGLVVEANKQIYAYNVAINELRRLLPATAPIPSGSVADPREEQAVGPSRDSEADVVHQDDITGLGE